MERRRSQRSVVGDVSWLSMPLTWQVQLLDISVGGVAFLSPYEIKIGRTALLRAVLGPEAVSTQVRVCWTRTRSLGVLATPAFEIGAVFMSLDEGTGRALRSLLRWSSPE